MATIGWIRHINIFLIKMNWTCCRDYIVFYLSECLPFLSIPSTMRHIRGISWILVGLWIRLSWRTDSINQCLYFSHFCVSKKFWNSSSLEGIVEFKVKRIRFHMFPGFWGFSKSQKRGIRRHWTIVWDMMALCSNFSPRPNIPPNENNPALTNWFSYDTTVIGGLYELLLPWPTVLLFPAAILYLVGRDMPCFSLTGLRDTPQGEAYFPSSTSLSWNRKFKCYFLSMILFGMVQIF